MKLQDYSFPVRWGIQARNALLRYSSSYGGRFYIIRRPLAVFFNTLLDDKHQEMYKGTIHQVNRKTPI